MHDAPRPKRYGLTRAAAPLLRPFALTLLTTTTLQAQTPPDTLHREATDPSRTRVTLRILPADATVRLDGQVIDPATELYLEPGTHTITVSASDHITREEVLDLEALAGREILMSINLSKEPATTPASLRHDGIVDQMGTGRPLTGWIMTAGGAALLTTSIIFAIRQANVLSECRDRGRCQSDTAATGWTTLTGAIGGASLLGGITLLSWGALAGEPVQSTSLPTQKRARDRVRGISLSLTF